MQAGMKNPNDALAGSTDFLHLFGHVCMGYVWGAHGQNGAGGGGERRRV